jgi:hypothetical protein
LRIWFRLRGGQIGRRGSAFVVRLLDAMMTRYISLLSVVVLALICAGCSDLSSNPTRAGRTIAYWLPVGTSDDDMKKIMNQHAFVLDSCLMPGGGVRDYSFYRVGNIHNWIVQVHEQDEKVATTNFPVRVFFMPMKT